MSISVARPYQTFVWGEKDYLKASDDHEIVKVPGSPPSSISWKIHSMSIKDEQFCERLKEIGSSLNNITINSCLSISSAAYKALADSPISGTGLKKLVLKNVDIEDLDLLYILDQKGYTITHLSLHDLPKLSSRILTVIAAKCPQLKQLDINFKMKISEMEAEATLLLDAIPKIRLIINSRLVTITD